MHLLAIEGVFDPGCGLGPVGDTDENRRCPESRIRPGFRRFAPVIAEKVVAVDDEIRQGFFRLCSAIEIVLDLAIVVDVVQAGVLVGLGARDRVVPHNDARRLDQA
jgi:hypothetical protein